MIDPDFGLGNWWHEQWILVFHNGGGYTCYDAADYLPGTRARLSDSGMQTTVMSLRGILKLFCRRLTITTITSKVKTWTNILKQGK